jgi:CheY-like chemotaxis protein
MSHIMIVDDDAPVRGMMAAVLTEAGYATSQASSGEECLAMLQEVNPDLVLLDVHMRGMDGPEVLARIAQVSQVPVVIVTATANPQQRADLVDDGAVACLGKPFRNDDLRGIVARAMGTRPGPH